MNWGDTKKMPITSRVVQETLRIASVLSFTFREAVEDVEFEGLFLHAFSKSEKTMDYPFAIGI